MKELYCKNTANINMNWFENTSYKYSVSGHKKTTTDTQNKINTND